MHLLSFPFDLQKLLIVVRLPHRSDHGRQFRHYESKGVGKQDEIKDWVKLSEWTRYQATCRATVDSKRRAKFVVEIPIERIPEYYVKNVMAVMCAITVLSFSAFGIVSDDLASRLSVVLTLLLTAVAFKIVIADSLPKVGYSTVMDVYVNALFVFMVLVAIQNCFATAIIRGTSFSFHDNTIDAVSFLTFFVAFALFHVYFLWKVKQATNKKKEELGGVKRASEAQEDLRKRRREQAEEKEQHQQTIRNNPLNLDDESSSDDEADK